MINDYFPLPPFSTERTQRGELLSCFVSLFSTENRMTCLEVEAAFAVILNRPREELWRDMLVEVVDANEVIDKEVVRTILMSLIKMSLFVECVSSAEITPRIDYFRPQLTKCFTPVIDCICDELPSPAGVEDVREVLYDHLHLVLPASYRPHLADRPVLLYSAVMNLRVYAGLANVLYTHLQEVVDGFDCVLLSKGNYVAFIESLTASKSLAPAVVCDIYSRLFACAETLAPQPAGIHRDSLLFLLSAFYPFNTAMATLVFDRLAGGKELHYDLLVFYLRHVYAALNEVRASFSIHL